MAQEQSGFWYSRFLGAAEASATNSEVAGIYTLWKGSIIVYVGKAETSVKTRLFAHGLGQEKRFDRATFIALGSSAEIRASEALAIGELKPQYNKVFPTVSNKTHQAETEAQTRALKPPGVLTPPRVSKHKEKPKDVGLWE